MSVSDKDVFTPRLPIDVKVNPILSLADWQRQREACEADPGGFHGRIAARTLHWWHPGERAWLMQDHLNHWQGWRLDGSPVRLVEWQPWEQAFDDGKAPYFRWYCGGHTNAAFNEVDRHVISGHGEEPAYFYEGDRWDSSAHNGAGGPVHAETLSRRELLLQSVLAALALQQLGLEQGDRIALNMPNCLPQIVWTEAAKRLGIIYTAVFGGFSDKTLADRIENAGAQVVITADGASRNAENVAFKEAYSDPALDGYLPATLAADVVRTVAEDHCPGELAAALVQAVRAALGEEITVAPADVMRIVGRELAAAGRLEAEAAVALRVALAQSLEGAPRRVRHVVVVRHAGLTEVPWTEGRDLWADELLAEAAEALQAACGKSLEELRALPDRDLAATLWQVCPPLPVEANFPLFIIYTSGSTGKPKGVVHCHGYLAGITHTMSVSFDAVPGRDRIYVVADPGWITGQSYLIAASLAARIPGVVTEGAPVFPHAGRFASIIQRHGITVFKAGVTFLKTVMANPQNRADVERYDLSSLRVATFCAEPTSPPVQRFGMALMTPQYINSYWATEHGGIVWTHPYGNRDLRLKSDARCYPLPWVFGEVWAAEGEADEAGRVGYRAAAEGERGEVVVSRPYPYLARTVWGEADKVLDPNWQGDIKRYAKTYFGRFRDAQGRPVLAYVQGDFAVRYPDMSFSFHGRSDDVINVSGHRLGTEEIEGAILKDKLLREDSPVGNCIVVGAPHRDKGQTPVAFLLEARDRHLRPDDIARLQALVREEKGAVAVPAAGDFIAVPAFPETRSGKYMRRMLRALILDEPLGDATTLRNPECLPELEARIAAWKAAQALAEQQQVFEDGRFVRVQYDRLGGDALLATVLIGNPPVNALSERVLDELAKTVEHLDRREDVKALVIASRRPGIFVAGADVRELLEDLDEAAEVQAVAAKAHAAFARLEAMTKPVIAALDGPALGGGCELALACHYRVGSRRARLGQPEINLFIPPGYGGTQRLPRLLEARADTPDEGISQALGLLLSGRSLNAEDAWALGLLDELVSGGRDVYSRARDLAVLAAQGDGPALAAQRGRNARLDAWAEPRALPWEEIVGAPYVRQCLAQAERVGRGPVAQRILALVRAGYEVGYRHGLAAEPAAFAEFVMNAEHGGRKGIRLFLDKHSPPLPLRPQQAFAPADLQQLAETGQFLPVGSPFRPGITPIPRWMAAWGIAKDPATGAPAHGLPRTHERELVVPVPQPGANEALLYVLASEMNFNDCWAITGIPISVFDLHDEDCHVTGSGALGMVVALGEALQAEGRLAVGQVVSVYSGISNLVDPAAGDDPMFTAFANQGYETPDGSHAQFMLAQGPQCIPLAAGLTLEQAGGYALAGGTVHRCLARSLDVQPGRRLLVEGAASGTGHWAVSLGLAHRLRVTGVVSSPERAAAVAALGAAAVDRRQLGDSFSRVPADPSQWPAWKQAGEAWLAAIRAANDGQLVNYAVSHAGETAFPRSFQALAEGGVISFFGASSGYHMTFLGKPGAASPAEMLARAGLKPAEGVLIHYGVDGEDWDHDGLTAIEAARAAGARIVVVTRRNAQRDLVAGLGFGDAVVGVVSLEALKRREAAFVWPDTLPELPDPATDTEAFKETVRRYTEHSFKPLAAEIGKWLKSADNPKGVPGLVIDRAGQDALALSTMLVAPFRGRVVYFEDLADRRYSFYAPQVWNRQRRILMPTAAIHGTHLANAAEVLEVKRLLEAGVVEVPPVHLFAWSEAPEGHQAIWENRLVEMTGGKGKALLNHALPVAGIRTVDELGMRWGRG